MYLGISDSVFWLACTLGPIFAAAVLQVADRKLPVWVKTTITMVPLAYHVYALGSAQLIPRQAAARQSSTAAAAWILFFAVTRWISSSLLSAERVLTVEFALDVVLPIALREFWEYLRADSSAEQRNCKPLAVNFAQVYALSSMVIVRPVIIVWTAKVVGVLVCYLQLLRLLSRLARRPMYWTRLGHYAAGIFEAP